jgi:Type III restriction enzyme, res subunit/Helicase C-terminal domain
MMEFDFGKLQRPTGTAKPTNPIDIFRASPALEVAPNDLWQGQSKALEEWNNYRQKKDILISLHTGAGKSLVGLLIAQSLINEGTARVLYVCATNDLVYQTSREATSKLGLQHTTRVEGDFSNNLYETGRGFCLTNYQALFNGRTTFTKDKRPGAIIFDDAHVAEKALRDCYTIRIARKDNQAIYENITTVISAYFSNLNKEDYYKGIVSGESVHKVALVPPHAVIALIKEHKLLDIFGKYQLAKTSLGYPLQHLADHIQTCSIFVSRDSIEITPAFLPSKRIDFLNDPDIRRIYLSATLTSEVDFCRAFGKQPSFKIEPESDAGMGERLMLLADKSNLVIGGKRDVSPERVAAVLSIKHKLLITTSSYGAAKKYESIATPPSVKEFSAELEKFRQQIAPGAFVLVARVDGIDLPHATCRVMFVDGLPTGFSLYEIYLYDFLEMRNSFAAKLANRITQMFGRTNRGRNDYSVIVGIDKQLVSWLNTPRNSALLPELLRKQLLLGKSLLEQFEIDDVAKFPNLVEQVIKRDPNWLRYYSESIAGHGDLSPKAVPAIRGVLPSYLPMRAG